jgi:ADP-ribosylglycohydrolase
MRQEAMKGAIIGALLGDAVGIYLEYLDHRPTEEEVLLACKMEGGGVFKIAPGQYSDDGEMLVTLLHALEKNFGKYDSEQVAKAYCQWFLSLPFDLSYSTLHVLGSVERIHEDVAQQMMGHAQRMNSEAKSNACMMRAAPLGVIAIRMSIDETIQMVEKDVRLTHPHPVCIDATTAYVLAIRHLILYRYDALGAVRLVGQFLYNRNPEVESWFERAILGYLPDSYPHSDFARDAFIYSFHYLYQTAPYEAALKEILFKGGDTDTNACIVGGLLGAFHGVCDLPNLMCRKLMRCNTKCGQQLRTNQYNIKKVMKSLHYLSY